LGGYLDGLESLVSFKYRLQRSTLSLTIFIDVPSPSFENTNRHHQVVGSKVFLEFSLEEMIAVHEIVGWLVSIFWDAGKERGDLIDTHDCEGIVLFAKIEGCFTQ
jgi:hypothetical protein